MITPDEIQSADRRIALYLQDGLLKKEPGHAHFTPFFVQNAKMSFQLAHHLQKISTETQTKMQAGFTQDYECFLWVVVIAYYSMFYAANAALAKIGIKVSDKIPHKVTQDALVVYFLKNGRLAKSLLEDYNASKTEVLAIMNTSEEDLLKDFQLKATQLIATFDYQRKKRGEFQYNIQTKAKQNLAQTSLERAKQFIEEMISIIEKK